jgi:homoserine kinase type II
MAVFTPIDKAALQRFLAHYRLGRLLDFAGIPSGITNTNYYVTTEQGEHVLTLFEQLTAAEIPFFLDFTAFLAERGIPCPHPVRDNRGHYLGRLHDKPAALAQRLRGNSVEAPTAAQLHLAGQQFPRSRLNDRGSQWCEATAATLANRIGKPDAALLHAELRFQSRHQAGGLPGGIIHADLFRDNVLFRGSSVSGLIDFYYACTDALLFDVAVTVKPACYRPITHSARLRPASARPGRRCCARRHYASGCRACTICISRRQGK